MVSEVPPGSVPGKQRFLKRNRLIAALTSGTVVVEASVRSGALSTANHAVTLLRPLGAVPGPVTSMASAGLPRAPAAGRRRVRHRRRRGRRAGRATWARAHRNAGARAGRATTSTLRARRCWTRYPCGRRRTSGRSPARQASRWATRPVRSGCWSSWALPSRRTEAGAGVEAPAERRPRPAPCASRPRLPGGPVAGPAHRAGQGWAGLGWAGPRAQRVGSSSSLPTVPRERRASCAVRASDRAYSPPATARSPPACARSNSSVSAVP